MAQNWMIHVVAEVAGCDAEVYLNDVPIERLRQHASAALSLPVHPQIVAGANELKLVINPGSTPAHALQAGSGGPVGVAALARARLLVVPLGAEPAPEAKSLLEVRFEAAGRPSAPGPQIQVASANLPLGFGKRVWEHAPPLLALSPDLTASALSFLAQVRELLQRGEAQRLAPLLRPKIADAAASYGLDPDQELMAFVQEWTAMSKTPGWLLAPVLAETASLRLCAGGRFVQCVAKDWQPLIRSADLSQGGVLLGLGIARRGDQWVIVA